MLENFPTRNEDFLRFTPDALSPEGWDLADRSEAVEARAYGSWYESIPDGPDGVSLTVTEMGGLTQLQARGVDHLLFTETGTPVGDEPNPSLSNMRKHGFKPLYLRENFAPKGTTW